MHQLIALCLQLPEIGDDGLPTHVPLLPAPDADGIIRGRDGRSWRVDPRAVVEAFDLPLAIDINHAGELKAAQGDDAPAVGWIEAIELRDDGSIWGRVDWTERGARAIKAREYRFISPVFNFLKKTAEVVRLRSAALVNDPNFALALNRRQSAAQAPEVAVNLLQKLIEKLGLGKDATEEQALNRVTELSEALQTATNRANELEGELATAKNKAGNPDLEKFVPRADYDQQVERATNLEQRVEQIEAQRAEEAVEQAINAALESGKITPATVEYHKAQCRAEGGLERFQKFVESAPVIAGESRLEGKRPPAAADPQEIARNARTLVDEEAAAGRRLSYTEAVRRVREQQAGGA